MVNLHTNHGVITLELDAAKAPITVENFLEYVKSGHFNNTIFHRVIDGFMIQGGDPTGTGRGGPGYTIPDEFGKGLVHSGPGILSMANAGPDTNSCEFFVTLAPTNRLNYLHSVFGPIRIVIVRRRFDAFGLFRHRFAV